MLTTAIVIVLAAAGFAGYEVTLTGRDRHPAAAAVPSLSSSAPATSSALNSALASALNSPAPITATAALPAAASVAAVLAGPLAANALGTPVLAQVTDADTGQPLFAKSATATAAPASTAKIATAVAVFAVHASTDRITTTVVAGASPGQIVLVGAGDPTLSGAAAGTATPYAGAARISDLAAQIKTAGVAVNQVIVDGRLFTGPATAPSWQKNDVPTDYASAITAVMSDGGRDKPTATVRSSNPDLGAGDELAADLGLPASMVTRGSAPAGAKQLATVQSASYGQLVEEMLEDSDNVIAEVLARQVAISAHQPASFTGAAAGVRSTVTGLGADIGAGMTDGSGLAVSDRLAPAALVALLRVAITRPELRNVINDLPVADWSGTLTNRYNTPPASAGAGLVRAKTGTLTSVSSLAGVVTTAKGRVLVFAFIAPGVAAGAAGTAAAEAALDVAAAALVGL